MLLTRFDISSRINIPESFRVETLAVYETRIIEGWLSDIVVKNKLTPIISARLGATNVQTELTELSELITPFLVYAVWAEYVFENNVQVSASGLVQKQNEASEIITPEQRAELRRYYRDLATDWAERIKRLLTPACQVSGHTNQPRFGSSKPANHSQVDQQFNRRSQLIYPNIYTYETERNRFH